MLNVQVASLTVQVYLRLPSLLFSRRLSASMLMLAGTICVNVTPVLVTVLYQVSDLVWRLNADLLLCSIW